VSLLPLIGLALVLGPADAGAPPVRTLGRAWRGYAHAYLTPEGRVVDHRGGITTSEGQAYGLLRAAWMGDERRFESVRTWTTAHLQGGDPTALPAWKFGPTDTAELAVMDPQPASDADLLYAYALLIGARQWQRPALQAQAVALAGHIWDDETLEVPGGRLLLPGPWAANLDPIPVNPSYFVPFVFRALAETDPEHDWMALVDRGYADLGRAMGPAGLPPDWFWVDPSTGELRAAPAGDEDKAAFGFEALRVPWNLAADLRWAGEPRAAALLDRLDPLLDRLLRDGQLPARIGADGAALVDYSWPGMSAALLPALARRGDGGDEQVWSRLAARWSRRGWRDDDDYYFANWLWFGVALWCDGIGAWEAAA
jgi:endoglucanase